MPLATLLAHRAVHPFIRFLVVGATNTGITFVVFHALYPILTHLTLAAAAAQACAYVAGAAFSFLANRSWTFAHGGGVSGPLGRFLVAQAGTMAASAAGMQVAVSSIMLHPTVGWALVTGATTVLNYLLMRHWVFAAPRMAAP